MNKFIVALGVLIVLVGGFFIFNTYVYQEKQVDEVISNESEQDVYLNQFEDRSIGIVFDYPDGHDGYVIDDATAFVAVGPLRIDMVKAYLIMNAKEKVQFEIELENSEGGREGPPSIHLHVFKNDQNQSASVWVDSYPLLSNIEMVLGEVDRDAVVGGANAVRYTIDGLYLTDNVVVASGGYIYHFSGSYFEPNSLIHQDFKAIIDSVRFIPSTNENAGSGAKIDIRIACNSALAYMLFQTSEQSDQFIEECINGEHPDVIERYINDMGVDGARI